MGIKEFLYKLKSYNSTGWGRVDSRIRTIVGDMKDFEFFQGVCRSCENGTSSLPRIHCYPSGIHPFVIFCDFSPYPPSSSRLLLVRMLSHLCTNLCIRSPSIIALTGKDRTGLVMALALAALGVPDEAIVDDYARSDAAYRELGDRDAMVGALAQVSDKLTYSDTII